METEGFREIADLEAEREAIKSPTMAFWEGLKLPYHMRLMVILPERRRPPWYSKGKESRSSGWSKKARFLAAAVVVAVAAAAERE